jgi:Icc-related predicted phosphoesterase
VARPGQPVGGRPLPPAVLRVAAGADLHCDGSPASLDALRHSLLASRGADLVLLAGDVTANGLPAEARAVAGLFAELEAPVAAVLGNHDLRAGADELAAVLTGAGIGVLRSAHLTLAAGGVQVGIVGTTGCAGGFHGRPIPGLSRGERRDQRRLIAAECAALEAGLGQISGCRVRIVLMHYSPTAETLHGEARRLLPLLGCDRLAGPIASHQPELVVHGHAHHGSFEARIGATPVFNASLSGFHQLEVSA